jgi:hypothetical protein
MSQSTVRSTQLQGFPGLLWDAGYSKDVISKINNSKKLDAVTITAADLLTTCTINGTAFTVNAGAAVKTKTELRDLLIAAINAGSEPVTASIKDADELYVESDVSGTTTTVVGTTNCSVAAVIPNESNVPFGVVVVRDDSGLSEKEDIAMLPNAAADITSIKNVFGVAVHQHTIEQNIGGVSNLGYAPVSEMSILRKGRIWVETEDVVTQASDVYVRHVAGAGEQRGALRSDTDGGDADILPSARWFKGSQVVNGINLAVLELNLP